MSLALGIFLLFMQLIKQGYSLHGVTRQLVQVNIKANRTLYSLKRAAHLAGFNLSKPSQRIHLLVQQIITAIF